MNCPYCAEPIADDSRFCPKCGTQMGSPLPGSPAYRQPLPPGFKPPTSGKAIGSLIFGLFMFFLPASIVAIILGHLSLSEIRKSAGRLKGQGLATAGLILGYLGIAAIPLILIIAAIAIPNLLRAKMAANEATAVETLRTYNEQLFRYASECPLQGYPPSPTFLPSPAPAHYDCPKEFLKWATMGGAFPSRHGYNIFYYPAGMIGNGPLRKYVINADPVVPGTTGVRHFYTDETGVVRVDAQSAATEDSEPLK